MAAYFARTKYNAPSSATTLTANAKMLSGRPTRRLMEYGGDAPAVRISIGSAPRGKVEEANARDQRHARQRGNENK